ncbi:ssDNA binding protein [Microbacterium phage DoTi]|nr:ssDNA binding protein [Microbacterium phage DoTi]
MTTTSSEVRKALTPFEYNGRRASWAALKRHLPDIETALFFAKATKMPWEKTNELLEGLFKSTVLEALRDGQHSTTLQDYLVEVAPPEVVKQVRAADYVPNVPHGEILPAMWDAMELQVAASIAEVVDKLSGVLDSLPGTQGQMGFAHLMQLNKRRPTIGDYRARISHQHGGKNLVVLDVSGSMSEQTVRTIAGDCVALAYKANAAFAIVSDTAKYWDPGTFGVDDVLQAAEYGGTHYETLAPLFDRTSWDVVVSIADYDSSSSAKRWVRENSSGTIEKLLDLSLVNKPTFLAEVLGQLAKSVEPLLVGNSEYVLGSSRYW